MGSFYDWKKSVILFVGYFFKIKICSFGSGRNLCVLICNTNVIINYFDIIAKNIFGEGVVK